MATVTAYETAQGKRYRVRYRKPDGSQTDKRGFVRKRDAELFLASTAVSKARGEYVDPTDAKMTVGELAVPWLNAQSHLKPSSRRPVVGAWEMWVKPVWGNRTVSSIRHSEVQSWITAMTNGTAKSAHKTPPGPRSATVVLRAYGILASILDVAIRDRRLSQNPARGVALPRKAKKPRAYLTHEQVERLAKEARLNAPVVRFLAYTGLRWGEMVALRVRNLDMLRRRARIEENAVYTGGVYEIGTPKSHEARTVPFPKFIADDLARLCENKHRDAYVFGDGTKLLSVPGTRDGWFTMAVKRARAADPAMPRVTPHDLRHTAASLAVSSGANVKAVQRMLGHASAAMTLDIYADLFDDDLDTVAARLDDARSAANVGKVWAEEPGDKPGLRAIPHAHADRSA